MYLSECLSKKGETHSENIPGPKSRKSRNHSQPSFLSVLDPKIWVWGHTGQQNRPFWPRGWKKLFFTGKRFFAIFFPSLGLEKFFLLKPTLGPMPNLILRRKFFWVSVIFGGKTGKNPKIWVLRYWPKWHVPPRAHQIFLHFPIGDTPGYNI